MTESLALLIFTFLTFIASLLIVLGGMGWMQNRRVASPQSNLQIRFRGRAQEVRVVQAGRLGWTICAEALDDLPQIGSSVQFQAPGSKGLAVYQAQVMASDYNNGYIYVTPPQKCLQVDRRDDSRVSPLETYASVDDQPMRILDISSRGARLSASEPVEEGDRVLVEFAQLPRAVFGWVLDCELDEQASTDKLVWQIRLRFEDEVKVGAFKSPARLALA